MAEVHAIGDIPDRGESGISPAERRTSLRGRARKLTAAVAFWWLIAGGAAQAAENWSRFRGPNGAGAVAEVNFPAAWADDDYVWKISLPGKGHSSPVAWGETVFVTSGDAETGKMTLSAIDATSGAIRWSRSFASTPRPMHGFNSYASSSPAVDAQRVYVLWAAGQSLYAAALSHAGEEAWTRELGPLVYQHGLGGSPTVVEEMLVIANDNSGESYVVALDAGSGEPRWRRDRASGTESYATPAVWRDGQGAAQIIVESTSEGMAALSPSDGSVLWQLPKLFPERCVSSPLVAGGLVLGGSGEGGAGKNFAAVRPAAAGGEATIAYTLAKNLPYVPMPVARRDLLFAWNDRGVVACYDLATGKAHWTQRVGGNYFASPVVAGDKLYSIAADGEVVALAAEAKYRLLGRTQLGEPTSATPAVQGGKMYLRTETSLACLPATP
jgi:outer membrane protein assembly factor BamB